MKWNCEYCGNYNTGGQCESCGGGTRTLPIKEPMSEREIKFRSAIMKANWKAIMTMIGN